MNAFYKYGLRLRLGIGVRRVGFGMRLGVMIMGYECGLNAGEDFGL